MLPTDDREAVAGRIRSHVYNRDPGVQVGKWVRHGIVPGIKNPGLTFFMASPAPYHAEGLARWVVTHVGEEQGCWMARQADGGGLLRRDESNPGRVPGTASAPEVGMANAVAASSAIPLLFRPYEIDGRLYVDGGVSSGTHADLVLGSKPPSTWFSCSLRSLPTSPGSGLDSTRRCSTAPDNDR